MFFLSLLPSLVVDSSISLQCVKKIVRSNLICNIEVFTMSIIRLSGLSNVYISLNTLLMLKILMSGLFMYFFTFFIKVSNLALSLSDVIFNIYKYN